MPPSRITVKSILKHKEKAIQKDRVPEDKSRNAVFMSDKGRFIRGEDRPRQVCAL